MHKFIIRWSAVTPLLRFVLDSSYKLYLSSYAAVGKNSTDTSRRDVAASAIAELLVACV